MFVIKTSKREDFIREMNENKITDSFLEECRKVSIIFNRDNLNIENTEKENVENIKKENI